MRTTVDLSAELLEEARRLWNFRTKRETLVAGLEELVRKARRERLRSLAGKVDLDAGLSRARSRKR